MLLVRSDEAVKKSSQHKEIHNIKSKSNGKGLFFNFQQNDFKRRLEIRFSQPARIQGKEAVYSLHLSHGEKWSLCIDFLPSESEETPEPLYKCGERVTPATHKHYKEIMVDISQIETDSDSVKRLYQQSVTDYRALISQAEESNPDGLKIAAGIPWYSALFGRDSLITAYQVLPFLPQLAKDVLRSLANLQGKRVNKDTVEEPGKILHEYRDGVNWNVNQIKYEFPYYGSINVTPLFLLLLTAFYKTPLSKGK